MLLTFGRRRESFLHRVFVSIRKMPPFCGIAPKTVLFHENFQKLRVGGGGFGAVGIIPGGFFGKVVKACGHFQLVPVRVHQRDVYGAATAVGTVAFLGIGDKGRVGADLPEPELGADRTEAVPDFQGKSQLAEISANRFQFFYGAVTKVSVS